MRRAHGSDRACHPLTLHLPPMQQETPSFDPIGAARDGAWRAIGEIAQGLAASRPDKGKLVTVIGGRKHKGKRGLVVWHGVDRYSCASRYDGNSMQAAMRQARGVYGYRVGVSVDGAPAVFVSADYLAVHLPDGRTVRAGTTESVTI